MNAIKKDQKEFCDIEWRLKVINKAFNELKDTEQLLNNPNLMLVQIEAYKTILRGINSNIEYFIKKLNEKGYTFEVEDFRKKGKTNGI